MEDASTTVLPAVRPGHTLILVLLAILPSLIALWRRPHPRAFVHTIVACSMGSFMLGWHVRGNGQRDGALCVAVCWWEQLFLIERLLGVPNTCWVHIIARYHLICPSSSALTCPSRDVLAVTLIVAHPGKH